MTRPENQGWFADVDDEQPEANGFQYQPCLQLDDMCHSFEIWFRTEAECEQWIRDEVLGKPMLERRS